VGADGPRRQAEGGNLSAGDDRPRWNLHGRRLGRPLRPGRRRSLEEHLPSVRVDPPVDGGPIDPARLFARPIADLWLEIGFGGGEHLVRQASLHPEVGLIGVEPFVGGVARALGLMSDGGLDNVRIHPGDARALIEALPDGSLGRVFILFPDPWRKVRHHKRRIVSAPVLDRLALRMRPGAELRLATDHPGYLCWILRTLRAHPAFTWRVAGPSDWRRRPDEWPETRYEMKAIREGRRPTYLTFVRSDTS
jgi:tRNA (guanine-N7-)-methyltransferase